MYARVSTPERWEKAKERAQKEQVHVAQLNLTGMWIATSGTKPGLAYQLTVSNGIAHSCTCAAQNGNDPVCKHRAAFYLLTGFIPPMQQTVTA